MKKVRKIIVEGLPFYWKVDSYGECLEVWLDKKPWFHWNWGETTWTPKLVSRLISEELKKRHNGEFPKAGRYK